MRVLVLVVILCALTSCGGNGLPPSESVSASVTPTTATVAVGGTVNLMGTGIGFTRSPLVAWGILESHSGSGLVLACGELPESHPSFTLCPYGYVAYANLDDNPSAAVYHAPPTPGTYHVVFSATQNSTFDYLTKTATATITVTP